MEGEEWCLFASLFISSGMYEQNIETNVWMLPLLFQNVSCPGDHVCIAVRRWGRVDFP